MRELSAGDDAVLLDFAGAADPGAAPRAADVLRAAAARGELAVIDVVPAAETVLVQAAPGHRLDVLAVRRVLRRAARSGGAAGAEAAPAVTIPVRYDGADLDEAAELAGTSAAAVIDAHTAIGWRVQFMGFAPGFGYLVPGPESPAAAVDLLAPIGRRSQARPAVPAGAQPPALLAPGAAVRFTCAD